MGGDGLVIERTDAGWETVLRGGPTGNGNDLYGAATTDDGKRPWFVGASGTIGASDVETGNLEDRSAPNDQTNNFNAVAVTGPAGDADVYVADGSGAIHYSFENGAEGTWDYVVPGSGSSLPAIEFHDARAAHAIDTNGTVFVIEDGTTWEAIGIEDADVTFYGFDSDDADDVTASGGNGSVLVYDGSQWTTESLGDADIRDVETAAGADYAVGGGGTFSNSTAATGPATTRRPAGTCSQSRPAHPTSRSGRAGRSSTVARIAPRLGDWRVGELEDGRPIGDRLRGRRARGPAGCRVGWPVLGAFLWPPAVGSIMATPAYALHRLRRLRRDQPTPPASRFDQFRDGYEAVLRETHARGGGDAVDDLAGWITVRTAADGLLPPPETVRRRARDLLAARGVVVPDDSPLAGPD